MMEYSSLLLAGLIKKIEAASSESGEKLVDIGNDISSIDTIVGNIDANTTAIETNTQGLLTNTASLVTSASSQLSELESLNLVTSANGSKLDDVNSNLSSIDGNIDDTNTKLDELITESQSQGTTLSTIETSNNDILSTSNAINTDTTSINASSLATQVAAESLQSIMTSIEPLIQNPEFARGDMVWTGTADSGYFSNEDYGTNFAKGNWENTTGGDVVIRKLYLTVSTTDLISTWNPLLLFSATGTGTQSRFRIGRSDTDSGNSNTEDIVTLDTAYSLNNYIKSNNEYSGATYLISYEIPLNYTVAAGNFAGLRIRTNLSASGFARGYAWVDYSES